MEYLGVALVYLFIVGLITTGAILFARSKIQLIRDDAERTLQNARTDAEKIVKDAHLKAKEEEIKRKDSFDKEANELRNEIKNAEKRLEKREDAIDRKAEQLQKREKQIEDLEKALAEKDRLAGQKQADLDKTIEEERKILLSLSGLSREEATRMILEKLEKELQQESAALIQKYKDRVKETCEQDARNIITIATQRWAAEHTASTTTSTVDLPNEEMKGRIIGREGRNIRVFERATGVDVIVDDTPGVIVVSAFDGVRREMARRALERLITDGRIHPARIEDVVEQTKKEMEASIMEEGKQVCFDLDIHGLHPKLVMLLGRLKYRTSYGQNNLQHVQEVAHLAGAMAGELKMDVQIAKRCGLLHDIGKAVDQQMEGGHPAIGAELLKRFGEGAEVVHAAAYHHEELNAEFPYTVLTMSADAISAARPGARRETFERYIKRLERLEAIANNYPGVEASYAIQAGREIRIIVDSGRIDDKQALVMARDIARDIENELTYPGEIRVTVLRETRVTEYAR